MVKDDVWEWRNIKKFFEEHIKEFEECLIK